MVVRDAVVALGDSGYVSSDASFRYTLYPLTGAAVVDVEAFHVRLKAESAEAVATDAGTAGVVMAVTGPAMVEEVSYLIPPFTT